MASGSATELFMEVGANAHRFSPYLRGFAISQRGNTEETEALGREWSEFVGINKGFALSASGSWDKSDAGVAGLEESLLEENKRFMAFYGYSADFSDGSNGVRHGDPAEFGVALKTEFAPASAYASQQTFDLTGTGTGALYDARVVYPYQITVPPFSNGDFNIAAWASGSYSLAVYSRQATQASHWRWRLTASGLPNSDITLTNSNDRRILTADSGAVTIPATLHISILRTSGGSGSQWQGAVLVYKRS